MSTNAPPPDHRSRTACWHHFEAGKRIFGIFALGIFFVLREKYFVEKKMKLKSCIKSIASDAYFCIYLAFERVQSHMYICVYFKTIYYKY